MTEYQELQHAIIENDLLFFKLALNNIRNINDRCTMTDNNILHYYIYILKEERLNYEIMDLLISEGIDINAKTSIGYTPLHFAVSHKQLDALKYLIQHGAKVDLKDDKGNTPLWIAVMHFKGEESALEIIKELIKTGANPYEPNNYGHTPRSIVLSRHKNMEIVGTPIEWNLQPHLNW